MSRLTIHEILTQANTAHNYVDKMNAIRENGSLVLEQILQYNFAEHLSFDLPEGTPPYKRETDIPIGKSASNLYQEGRRLYIFLKGQAPNMNRVKKELLFIQILEGLHYTDADILVAVKDKRLQELFPNITYEYVFNAIPDLLPPPETRQNVGNATKTAQKAPEATKPVEVEEVPVPFVEPPVAPVIKPEQANPKAKRDFSWKIGLPVNTKKVDAPRVRAEMIAAGKLKA